MSGKRLDEIENETNKVRRLYPTTVIFLFVIFASVGLFSEKWINADLQLPSIDDINRAADAELRLPGVDQIEREAEEGLDLPSVCEILGTCGGGSGGGYPSNGYP